jgi:hypothetical protein
MSINRNFVVKNGLQVNQNLILADATTNKVGIGTTVPKYDLHVNGGIGATFAQVTGVATVTTAEINRATVNVGFVTHISGTNLNYTGVGTITNLEGTDIDYSGTGNINTLFGDYIRYDELHANVGIITSFNTLGVGTIETRLNVGLGGTVLTALNSGLVGIGTENPEYVLDIRSAVSTGQTAFYVQGDVRITGDLNVDDITFDDATVQNLTVTDTLYVGGESGIATITTLGVTNLTPTRMNISGISTITTLVGTNINYSGVGTIATFNTTNLIPTNINSSGVSTLTTLNSTNLTSTNINSSGVSTLTTLNATNLTSTNINSSGVSTLTTLNTTNLIPTNINSSGVSTLTTLNSTVATLTNNTGTNINYSGVGTITTLNTTNLISTNVNASGVITATTFVGAFTGTATTATKLSTPRTFEITGDVVASAISFDGTGNVSLAATIQPNSVGLGTDTTGDYVTNITGTSNQITVTSGTGEGSTPILSIPNQFTTPQDATVTRDLQVNRNLSVNENINASGISTLTTLLVTNLQPTNINVSGISTLTNNTGININYSGVSTLTTLNTTNLIPTNINSSGVSTLTTLNSTVATLTNNTGTNINYSGVGTIGTLQVSSGIVTASSGIITYYGDGQYLNLTSNPIRGIGIGTTGGVVGYGITFLDLKGAGVSTTFYNSDVGIATIFFEGGGSGSTFSGVGVATEGVIVGTGVTLFDLRGSGISTVTVTSGIATVNIIGSSGGGTSTIAISTNTTNQAQYITYAISTGSTTGLGVTTSGLTFNPSTGNMVVGGTVTANSDKKLKTNIKTIENALEKVLSLRGVEYDRIDNKEHQIGVIAQEVEKIIPYVVYGEETKSVAYGNMIGLLIEAVKDLTIEVQNLKDKLNDGV